jgi:phosphatidylinositol 4-kinase B
MQAHLSELSLTHRDTKQFAICQRVIQKCHELIYGQIFLHNTSTGQPPPPKLPSSDVSPHFVGLGSLLSAIALPALAVTGGEMAVLQARHGDGGRQPQPVHGKAHTERLKADPAPEEDEDLMPPVDLPSSPEDSHFDLAMAFQKSSPRPPATPVPPSDHLSPSPKRASTTSLVDYPPTTPSIDISSATRRSTPKKTTTQPTPAHKHLPTRSTPSLGLRPRQFEDETSSLSVQQQNLLLKKHYLQSQVSCV